jgi:hypothetical protein
MNKNSVLNTLLDAGLTPSTPLPQALESLDRQIKALNERIRQDSKTLADLHEAKDFLATNRPKPVHVHLRPEHARISGSLASRSACIWAEPYASKLIDFLERHMTVRVEGIPHTFTHIQDIR